MKRLLLLLCLIIFGLTAKSQEIKLDSLTYDFGKIKVSNEDYKVSVHFTNTGKKPLIIESIQWSVSDMIAYKPIEPIHPGKDSSFEIKFMINRTGKRNRYLTVRSNATNQETTVFRIKYEVID